MFLMPLEDFNVTQFFFSQRKKYPVDAIVIEE